MSAITSDHGGMHTPLAEVAGLAKSWGAIAAVCDVSFTLAAGERLALIGPNGAGKSTCFDLLTGQTRPDRGTVRLLGTDTAGLLPHQIWRLGVARTFQVAATFASMTVVENVQVALLSHAGRLSALTVDGLARPLSRQWRAEALALLDRVGMRAQAERSCGVLAYGDIKRVELALALASHPRVLFMDEPTAGMSPPERAQIMNLVTELSEDEGIGVLFTEHDMDAVFTYATRVLVLHQGRLIANGPPLSVRNDARVREVYLGTGLLSEKNAGPNKRTAR